MAYKLTDEVIKLIETILQSDDRAELIPAKNGEIKVIHIIRKEVKPQKCNIHHS